jgi:hypothetical protein
MTTNTRRRQVAAADARLLEFPLVDHVLNALSIFIKSRREIDCPTHTDALSFVASPRANA